MKRILALILSMLLVLTAAAGMLAVSAEAELAINKGWAVEQAAPTLTVGNVSGKPGENVTVVVTLSGNTGFAYLNATLTYDYDALTLVGITSSATEMTLLANGDVFSLDNATNHTGDGELLVLTFKIADTADAGDYAVSLQVNECWDEIGDEVSMAVEAGTVTVTDANVPEHTHTAAAPVKENETAATCTTAGSYQNVVYCSECGDEMSRETVTVPAIGHTEETIPGKPATETETGLTDGVKCSVCGETLVAQEEVPMLPSGSTEPTWTVGNVSGKPGQTVTVPVIFTNNPGIFSFTISTEYDTTRLLLTGATINLEGLGGSQTIGKRFVWLGDDADSTFNGEILYLTFEILADAPAGDASVTIFYEIGNVCNYDEEDVLPVIVPGKVTVTTGDAPEHTHTAGSAVIENNVAPGCETAGSYDTVVRCTECGEEMSRETTTVSATDHNYEDAVIDPTCTADGYTIHMCSECDSTYTTDETPATGHNAGDAVEEDGFYVTRCEVCGEELNRTEITTPGDGEETTDEVEDTNEVEDTTDEADTHAPDEDESVNDEDESDGAGDEVETTTVPEEETQPSNKKSSSTAVGIIIAVAVIAVGGAACAGVIVFLKKRK